MENKKVTENKKEAAMTREDFAVLWKTIHLKITDTYDVPPEILWVIELRCWIIVQSNVEYSR